MVRELSAGPSPRQGMRVGDPEFQGTIGPVPADVVHAGWELVVERVGFEFVREYVFYDSARSRRYAPFDTLAAPQSNLVFTLSSDEKPYVKGRISFHLDDSGQLDPRWPTRGIPDCEGHIGGCKFVVDEAMAEQRACSAGLDPGIGGYDLEFTWSDTRQRYVWVVTATYERTEWGASGKDLIVDVHTGEVYGSLNMSWETYYAKPRDQVVPN